MIYKLGEHQPQIDDDCFVAPSADVIGKVRCRTGSSIWFGAVIRGDNELITVGENSNIQENCVLHTDPGFPLTIATGVTIGHQAMLHGCEIGEFSLVGIGSVILNGAKIGRECLVGAKALITENMVIEEGSLVLGAPAKVVRQLTQDERLKLRQSAQHYVDKAAFFKGNLLPL